MAGIIQNLQQCCTHRWSLNKITRTGRLMVLNQIAHRQANDSGPNCAHTEVNL